MEIVIQQTELSMAPILAGLHAACFKEAPWTENQIKGSLALASTQGWLALAEGTAAGFLLSQQSGNESEILTLGVHPLYRLQGIGIQLVKHMLATLPPGGAAFLEVASDNEAARALYAKCGFVRVNTRKGYYKRGEKLIDAVCYRYLPPDLQR